jgi:branched-chain amino acid transport system ATP-binding protein
MANLLSVEGVSVHFAGLKALTDVSFALEPGDIRAVIGPNGAGKTTLFNVVTGYVAPTAGSVRYRGAEIGGRTPHEISARGLRRTFQNGGLFAEMTVLENVLAGLHVDTASGFFGLLFGGRRAVEAERGAVRRARELLEIMEIGHLADQPARDLSGGQQRMVEIVRAIATDPPLLLLDEPAVGLAPPVRETLMGIVRTLAKEREIAILLIEHAIEMVMSVSDAIIVLNNGQKIAEGPPDAIRQDRAVLEAYLGHA